MWVGWKPMLADPVEWERRGQREMHVPALRGCRRPAVGYQVRRVVQATGGQQSVVSTVDRAGRSSCARRLMLSRCMGEMLSDVMLPP